MVRTRPCPCSAATSGAFASYHPFTHVRTPPCPCPAATRAGWSITLTLTLTLALTLTLTLPLSLSLTLALSLTLTKARGAAGRRGGGEIRRGRRPFRASAGYTYRGYTYSGHTYYGHTYYGYTYYSDIDFGYTYYGHTDLVPFNTPPLQPILPFLRPPSSRLSIPYPPLHYAILFTTLCRCAASWRPRCTRRAPAPPPTSWRHGGFEP